jgi:hypothetical protein
MPYEKVNWKVPHDEKGNHLSYASPYNKYQTDPYEFEATLRYAGYERGRSAFNINWVDIDTGKTYVSGMPLLDDLLRGKEDILTKGDFAYMVKARFCFKKQGSAVLLHLAK